jgi:hypothetical protein
MILEYTALNFMFQKAIQLSFHLNFGAGGWMTDLPLHFVWSTYLADFGRIQCAVFIPIHQTVLELSLTIYYYYTVKEEHRQGTLTPMVAL